MNLKILQLQFYLLHYGVHTFRSRFIIFYIDKFILHSHVSRMSFNQAVIRNVNGA
jgi:hypothetical protein